MTKQRELVLEVVRARKEHYTAAQIFELAKKRMPTISRATVYNNLKSLEKFGLIRRVTGDDAFDRYDGSFVPHGHMVCTECARMWDFDSSHLDALISDAVGCAFTSYELKVRTVCDECAKIIQDSKKL